MAGKGDRYRQLDYSKWSEGWDKTFGKKKQKTKEEIRDEALENKMNFNMEAEDLND
tara:strand:+ start:290 stop:457 length:168 start_codon:yes stop_codon:yes gene_type:complete